MGNNSSKKTMIIAIVIIVLVAILVLYFGIFAKEKKVEYYLTTSNSEANNTFFEDYQSFKKFYDKNKGIEDTLTNKVTFKKTSLSETFTEEFFENKKLALVAVYEDTSKDYMYSIDKLEYNSDKTEATITYTYKYGTFADVLSSTWYDYMFVELDSSVEKVNFVKDNNSNKK